jgi:hypothetical protein
MSSVDYGFFPIVFLPFTCVLGRGRARKTRRLILLLSVDWVPPDVRPSGAGLDRGTRVCFRLFTPPRVTPHRGCAAADERSHVRAHKCRAGNGLSLSRQRYLPGDGPHEGDPFPSHGHPHLIGVFAAGASLAVALAQPHLCLPTDILERRREFFETALEMAAHRGRIAVGPSAFNQRPAGMGIARHGDRALPTPLTTGVC